MSEEQKPTGYTVIVKISIADRSESYPYQGLELSDSFGIGAADFDKMVGIARRFRELAKVIASENENA